MTQVNNTVSAGVLLKGTAMLVRTAKGIWIAVAAVALLVLGLLASGAIDVPGARPDLGSLGLVGVYCAFAYGFFHTVGGIVGDVQKGEIFTVANGAKFRVLGWLILVLGLFDWTSNVADLVARIGEIDQIRAWHYVLSGLLYALISPALLLAAPVLFITGRIFDAGAAMRETVEGTI